MPSSPDNTLQAELHKILGVPRVYNNPFGNEIENETVTAILAAIQAKLPKEDTDVEPGMEHWDSGNYDDSYNYGWAIGYNAAIKDTYKALLGTSDIESDTQPKPHQFDNVSGSSETPGANK